VELLVVITIIGILATIGVQVSAALSTKARVHATNVTLSKIDTVLRERYEAITQSVPKKLTGYGKVHYVKNALIRYMPQVEEDFTSGLPNLGYYSTTEKTLLNVDPFSNTGVGTLPGMDPAELLYEMVTQKTPFGTTKFKFANKTVQEFSGSEIGDLDGDGKFEILDGWGTPIRFYRWPTRLLKPAGSAVNGLVIVVAGRKMTPAELNVDPLDPYGLDFTENIYSTRNSFSRPMAISAGPDRNFGLADYSVNDSATPIRGHLASPADLSDYGPIYDNLTSLAAKLVNQ